MPRSSPREAEQAYIEPLQKALACIARGRLIGAAHGNPKGTHPLTLEEPVPLNGPYGYFLSFVQHYKLHQIEGTREWKATTISYLYAIENAEGKELFAYHWHVTSKVKYPHFHILFGAGLARAELMGKHFPTHRMAFEEFVYLLVEELEVVPLKDDWRSIVTASAQDFREHSSWSVQSPLGS